MGAGTLDARSAAAPSTSGEDGAAEEWTADTLTGMDGFGWGDLIALMVAVAALVGWWDNRRRITRTAIAFKVEADDRFQGWFWVRNSGQLRVEGLRIDTNSVAGYQLERNTLESAIDPGERALFILHPNRSGDLPDSIRLEFAKRAGVRSRVVQLPQPGGRSGGNPPSSTP